LNEVSLWEYLISSLNEQGVRLIGEPPSLSERIGLNRIIPKSKRSERGRKRPSGINASAGAGGEKTLPSVTEERHAIVRMRSPALTQLRTRLTQVTSWNPTVSNQLVVTRNPAAASDWTSLSSAYDSFTVLGMKVTVLCAPPTQESTVTAISIPVASALAFAYDNDRQPGTLTLGVLADYDTFRVFTALGPVSYHLPALPDPMVVATTGGAVASSKWVDCSAVTNMLGFVIAMANAPAGTATSGWSLIVEWDVVFRGRI